MALAGSKKIPENLSVGANEPVSTSSSTPWFVKREDIRLPG